MASPRKKRLSFVKFSQMDLKDLGLLTDTENDQKKCESGTPSEHRRLSYVKWSDKDLKDLGLFSSDTANITNTCDTDILSAEPRRLSFVKFSQRDLKDLGFSSNGDRNIERMREPVSGARPKKLQKMLQTSKQKSVTNIYNIRKSTITKRSSSSKKEVQKKTVTRIKNIVYNTLDKDREKGANQNKTVDVVENTCKTGARKELFKMPSNRPSKITKAIPLQWNKNNLGENVHQSPLMAIEEAEILLRKAPCLLPQSIDLPYLSTVGDKAQNFFPTISVVQDVALNTSYPDLKFEMEEKLCEQQETEQLENVEYLSEIKLIYEMLEKDREEFQRYSEAREKRINNIFGILSKIKNYPDMRTGLKQNSYKENFSKVCTPCRQTPVSIKFTRSPSRVDGLRKNLLQKNFFTSNGETPKTIKAQTMYDNLRKTFSLLETPKFGKSCGAKENKNMSMKLQEQCLLLLETPQGK